MKVNTFPSRSRTPSSHLGNGSEIAEVPNPSHVSQDYVAHVKRQSVRGAASFFLRTVLLQAIGLATIFILSSFFSPEDFAVYGIVVQIIGILVFFSDIGLAAALIQAKSSPTENDYKTAFSLQQLLSWLIFGICVLIATSGFLVDKTGAQTANWILLALGFSFPLASLKTIPAIQLERELDFSKLVIPQIVEQLLFNIILVALAWQGMGAMSYAPAILIRSIVGVVVMHLIRPWWPKFGIHPSSVKKLLGYGVKFQLNDLLARVKDNLFFLALGLYLPLKDFGYVQWAKNWSMYPYNMTVQNVMAVTFPTFSRLQGQTHLLKRAIEKSLFFISLAIFPILIGMSVFIYPLVTLISQYNKWQPAVLSVIMFTLSILGSALSTPLTNTLNAIGKISTTLKLMVFWTTLTWVLTPLLVIRFGYQGVAISALVISLTSVMPFWFVKKYVPIEPWDQVWRQVLASLLMAMIGVLGMPWWLTSLPMMMIGMILTSLVYLVVLILTGYQKLKFEVRSILQHR